MSWLNQAAKGIRALTSQKKDIPDNLWRKCPKCSEILYHRELDRNLWVCGSCGHYADREVIAQADEIDLDEDAA